MVGRSPSSRSPPAVLVFVVLLLLVGTAPAAAVAVVPAPADRGRSTGDVAGSTGGPPVPDSRTRQDGEVCPVDRPAWRDAQVVAGVRVQASRVCRPDNPFLVAAVTNGTNNVPASVLAESGLAPDAVVKRTDRDVDGDPDVVEITLEVHGLPRSVYPMGMFTIEVDGPGRLTGSFVTPATNYRLHTHCSLPQHQQKGMLMEVVVGDGSAGVVGGAGHDHGSGTHTHTAGGHSPSGGIGAPGFGPLAAALGLLTAAVAVLVVARRRAPP